MNINISNKTVLFLQEFSLALTLYPYLYLSCTTNFIETRLISLIIFMNGILCHLSLASEHKYKNFFTRMDILSNGFFIIYINYYSLWQPYSIILSSLLPFIWFKNHDQYSWYKIYQHIFLIQGTGFICLFNYGY